jgi:Zn-dependent protease with chaperone function
MKKFLVLIFALFVGTSAFADVWINETALYKNVDKIVTMGNKIIKDNGLKRMNFVYNTSTKIINAGSNPFYKTVTIYAGILPYLDSDDELAYVVAHEISHSIESYGGLIKVVAMKANSKKYEYKADLNAVDYMVKSGYNPIAAIIATGKINPEPLWDWGFTSTHPKGSKRMLALYKYIYVKYPKYLQSDMTKNVVYQNFLNAENFEINKFVQKQKRRQMNQEDI